MFVNIAYSIYWNYSSPLKNLVGALQKKFHYPSSQIASYLSNDDTISPLISFLYVHFFLNCSYALIRYHLILVESFV